MHVMRVLLIGMFIVALPVLAGADIIPISDVNENDANGFPVLKDSVVVVQGVAVVATGTLGADTDIYIQDGTGGVNDVLAGGHGSLTGPQPQKTVGSYWPYATTVFDYVRRAMPFQSPGSLSSDELYAVTAYLLFVNDIIAEDAEMSAESLPQVKMPNRDNFVWGYTPK